MKNTLKKKLGASKNKSLVHHTHRLWNRDIWGGENGKPNRLVGAAILTTAIIAMFGTCSCCIKKPSTGFAGSNYVVRIRPSNPQSPFLHSLQHEKRGGVWVPVPEAVELYSTLEQGTGDPHCLFYVSNMNVDVDGSPRAYASGNRKPRTAKVKGPLDNESSRAGSSRKLVQGQTYQVGSNRFVAKGPPGYEGYEVSETSLYKRGKPYWETDTYVNSEEIPYAVFPRWKYGSGASSIRRKLQNLGVPIPVVGTIVIIVDLGNNPGKPNITSAIFADSHSIQRVGEGSIAVLRSLGRTCPVDTRRGYAPYAAHRGDEKVRYFHLVLPETVVTPASHPPYWSRGNIHNIGKSAFETWGGLKKLNDSLAVIGMKPIAELRWNTDGDFPKCGPVRRIQSLTQQ